MMKKNKLIFLLDDDLEYGRFVKIKLSKENSAILLQFTDENRCLESMCLLPDVIIVDYQLKNMTGLQFIEKAKLIYPKNYVILLSGEFYKEDNKFIDERFIKYIDRYLVKGMDEISEIVSALNNVLIPA